MVALVSTTATVAVPLPRRHPVRAVVAALRPSQWIKNGLVLAAAGAAGAFGRDEVALKVLLAFASFCLLASGIYAINDVRDAAEDRLHPKKCRRPVAARELSPAFAVSLGVVCAVAGLSVSAALGPLPAAVAAAYLALTLSYTMLWRHVFLLDILAVAGGFVLRALDGGVAAGVPLSRWFVLVVSAGAVFVAASKRLAELRRANVSGAGRRRVLRRYTPGLLQTTLLLSALTALVAYGVWALALPTVAGFPWRPLTVLPFAGCLIRYLWLVRAGAGEAPEELILGDPVVLVSGAAWIVLFALGVHAGA